MQDTSYELLTIFRDGGFMMVPLVLCSLVALGVILAKGWTLLVAHIDSQKLLQNIEELGTTGRLDEAIAVARSLGKIPGTSDPEEVDRWLGLRGVLAQCLHGKGDVEEAVALLERIPQRLGRGRAARATLRIHLSPARGALPPSAP